VKTPILRAKLQKQVGVFGAASLFLPAGEEAEALNSLPTAD